MVVFICLCFILQLGRIKRSKVCNVNGLHRIYLPIVYVSSDQVNKLAWKHAQYEYI